ncbi:DUF2927 domain-containing protein [uncultured Maritimibacter sp.]|uniref:DUF2927 domain-containing protein n=1 Tax=uncultured Maritimibacter sp. TaxID=991866 RepID=UPI0025972BAB|nr:DUF2927 domain-containing protein [uncultured Maritimibacter sp.]
MRIAAVLLAACLPGLALAQEFVEANGPMSDDDFYNAVSCGADPGGECRKPLVKWDRLGPIRIAVRQIDDAYLGGKKLRAAAALERAIQALNGADAGFRVVEVDAGADAEIEVFFFDLERGDPIAGTGIEGVDGSPLGGASTRVLFERETGRIRQVAIIFSTTLQIRAYESVMLEELTQAMGLMTDIRNPYYDETSVFSQDTNASTELGEQDIMALKRHYARP